MNVKELEIAVTKLSPVKLDEFASWFDKYQETLWDNQIESDVKAGKLDSLLNEVKLDFDNKNYTSL
jgi:hypothetical protein